MSDMRAWFSEDRERPWLCKHWLAIAVLLGVLIFGLLAFFVYREIRANWNYYTAVYGEMVRMLVIWACMMVLGLFGCILAYFDVFKCKSTWIPIQKYGSFRK